MKAQTTIIQFVVFFILGLAIFASIGSYFKYQSDLLQSRIASSSLQMLNNYVTTFAIEEYSVCKTCNFANITIQTPNVADYVVEMKLDPTALTTLTQPPSTTVVTTLANLAYSLAFTPSTAFTAQGITLTYDKNKNSIVVQ